VGTETARFISGGTDELALWVYHQRDKQAALKEASRALQHIIDQLRSDVQQEPLRPLKTKGRRS
jgi:hypothetical protein